MSEEKSNPGQERPSEQRESLRLSHRSKVRLTDANGRVSQVLTRDLSHGGLFLVINTDRLPALRSRVWVQAMDIEDALEQEAEVVRVESAVGIAIKFSEC